MRKLFVVLIAFVLVFSVCSLASAEKFVVTADTYLRVRDAPQENVIGQIKHGTVIDAYCSDKYWACFDYNGTTGYAYMDYLAPDCSCEPEKPDDPCKPEKPNKPVTHYTVQKATKNDASMIYVVSDSVRTHINARAYKSDFGTILGPIYPGELVYVITYGSEWSKIVYDGRVAYCKSCYLEEYGYNLPTEEETDGELYEVSVEKGTTLNVRSGPSRKNKVVNRLSNGAYVLVVEFDDDWAYVYYSSTEAGYVMTKYLVPAE